MGRKYFDEINVKEGPCSVMTTEQDKKRGSLFAQQRETYGFDERETWCMEYTMAEWLYAHLKMFLEIGGEVVDFRYHHFTVPTLIEKPKDASSSPNDHGAYTEKHFSVVEQDMVQEDAILLCMEYLKFYLQSENLIHETENTEEQIKLEACAVEKLQCALHIFAVISPSMWW